MILSGRIARNKITSVGARVCLWPAPVSVIAEVAVELAREQRHDAKAIEAHCARLLARNPELFQGPG